MENNNPTPNPQDGKLVSIDTKVEQKSHLDKLAEVFLPEDLTTVSNSIVDRVIIPSILKTAGEILHKSIDMIFGTNFTNINQPAQPSPEERWTAYRNTAAQRQQTGTLQILPVRSGVPDYKVIKFKTENDAQYVLNNMRNQLQLNGFVSLGYYMQQVGQNTIPEDFNYGWTNLTTVKLQRTGDITYPFRMILPTPIAIRQNNDDIFI